MVVLLEFSVKNIDLLAMLLLFFLLFGVALKIVFEATRFVISPYFL